MKKREKEYLAERKSEGLCNAILHHGPGHQSRTFCELKGNHKIHKTEYGLYRQVMEWKGKEACTDFWDDPKEL